jgi:hypothetical protein
MISFFLLNATTFGQKNHLYVKLKKENIRSNPNGEKIGEALAGTKVKVLESKTNWIKVQLTGWIWKNSLTEDSTMASGFTIRASHILVETKERALELLDQIKHGADFEELAKQYSTDNASSEKGGDVGEFERGDLLPEFEDTVLQLKNGEVSNIVKTDFGYHIIKRTK